MNRQLSLLDPIEIEMPFYEPGLSISEKFEVFDEANPVVCKKLIELALRVKRRGIGRYGMKALFEVLRYDHAIRTRGDDFKLNNNFTALYSRKIMAEEPVLDGFFETRERRAL